MRNRGFSFWWAFSLILASVISVALVLLRVTRIPFIMIDIFGARNSIVHWVGWAGAITILIVTGTYFAMKRARPLTTRRMLKLHAVGNLTGFLLVSIHFAHEVTRPAANYPDLGTGIVQYVATIALVSSGFPTYFSIRQSWLRYFRFLHPAAALTLLMSIVMHIIHGIS